MPECFEATANRDYVNFIRQADKFFGVSRYVSRSFPEWDSNSRQLQHGTLSNGMLVDLDLSGDNPYRSYKMSVIYPEGERQQPASHFIEHMLSNPQGLGDRVFRLVADSEINLINGQTTRETTEFSFELHPLALRHLHGLQLRPFHSITSLLYGMTVRPDFSEEAFEREKARVAAELAGYRDDKERVMADFIVPLIVKGRSYASAPLDRQIGYSLEELKQLHRTRPHSRVRFEVVGNPQAPNAAEQIIEGINNTFGQLAALDMPVAAPIANETSPLFPFGRKVRVIPSSEQASNYLGIASLVRMDAHPYTALAQQLFDYMKSIYLSRELHIDGYSYQRPHFRIEFPSDKAFLNFSGGNTLNSPAADSVINRVLDFLAAQRTNDHQNLFDFVRFSLSDHLFRQVDLDRVRFSRSIGLPITNNCSELYYMMRNLDIDDVLKVGRQMLGAGSYGSLHYGPAPEKALASYQVVTEKDLRSLWES